MSGKKSKRMPKRLRSRKSAPQAWQVDVCGTKSWCERRKTEKVNIPGKKDDAKFWPLIYSPFFIVYFLCEFLVNAFVKWPKKRAITQRTPWLCQTKRPTIKLMVLCVGGQKIGLALFFEMENSRIFHSFKQK